MVNYSPASLAHNIDWRIKSFPVFRILDDTRWLDDFFETGEIQLSSFLKFRSYKDEMQGDKTEGEGALVTHDDEGNTHMVGYESGLNGYILSTTSSLEEQVVNDFNGKCAIRINHPTMFGLEMSKKLPFVNSGLEGLCDYVDSRINFLEAHIKADNLLSSLKKHDPSLANHYLSELTKGIELFAKHTKYAHQREYRLIWFSNHQKVADVIKIKCPEAIRYCDKILF